MVLKFEIYLSFDICVLEIKVSDFESRTTQMSISNLTDKTEGQFSSVEEIIEELRSGKVIIVVDDESRENEGDFICAAEKATPEIINLMATEGKGIICAAITNKRAEELKLDFMVERKAKELSVPRLPTNALRN